MPSQSMPQDGRQAALAAPLLAAFLALAIPTFVVPQFYRPTRSGSLDPEIGQTLFVFYGGLTMVLRTIADWLFWTAWSPGSAAGAVAPRQAMATAPAASEPLMSRDHAGKRLNERVGAAAFLTAFLALAIPVVVGPTFHGPTRNTSRIPEVVRILSVAWTGHTVVLAAIAVMLFWEVCKPGPAGGPVVPRQAMATSHAASEPLMPHDHAGKRVDKSVLAAALLTAFLALTIPVVVGPTLCGPRNRSLPPLVFLILSVAWTGHTVVHAAIAAVLFREACNPGPAAEAVDSGAERARRG